MVRLIHFSDIHITSWRPGWRRADWFTKRSTGWFNLRYLGRGRSFHEAEKVLARLAADMRERPPDHVIFSGDASALGFEEEVARAAALLKPESLPGLAVPGNHDYYTRGVAASRLFERYFGAWQQGERVDDATYPFAQRVGPLWLVAVNSSTGNRWPWDASGGVGSEQLTRLEALLARLGTGPRILVTHYPICLQSGARERRYHRLRDLADLIRVAENGKVVLWLHGHRHTPYYLAQSTVVPFPVICTGTATQRDIWSFNEYTIEGRQLQAVRRGYSSSQEAFQEVEKFDLHLPGF